MAESRAIIRSMAHEHAKPGRLELIFWDAKQQAVVANWVDVEDHWFEPPALVLIDELIIKPKKGLDPNPQIVSEAKARLSKVLDVYEAQLTKKKYLAADRFTIADLLHLPNLERLMNTTAKNLIESHPHVSAWCADILARPAWAKVRQMQKKARAN